MSGVLERMAKGALGALPTVQPVTAPRFGPPVSGFRETVIARETALEMKAPDRGTEAALRSPGRDESELGKRGEAFENRNEPRAHERAQHELHAKERDLPLRAQTPRANAWEAKPDDYGLGANPGAVAKRDGESIEGRIALPPPPDSRKKRMPGREGSSFERAVEFAEANSPESESESLLKNEDLRRETWEIAKRNRKVAESQHPESREPRLSARHPQPPAEEKTEIHISIGSIELRAPRMEPRPQAAPFRPRVTLDEFLRRKPEARA
ncbi:MAG: hypothetical protein ACRD3N_14630 [Terracidiphilus sp.]